MEINFAVDLTLYPRPTKDVCLFCLVRNGPLCARRKVVNQSDSFIKIEYMDELTIDDMINVSFR